MKILAPALLALFAAPAATIPISPAPAQAATDCATQTANLRTTAGGMVITGKNAAKDRKKLMRRLDDTWTELAKGRNADAAEELVGFKVKVQKLADAGRISGTDAASLLGQADGVVACTSGSAAG